MSQKGLKEWVLLLVSMEAIDEVIIVSVKRNCSSCKVVKDDDLFVKSVGNSSFFKTCQPCRDSKKKYRNKVKASKAVIRSALSTPPVDFGPIPPTTIFLIDYDVESDDFVGLSPPPPGIGL